MGPFRLGPDHSAEVISTESVSRTAHTEIDAGPLINSR